MGDDTRSGTPAGDSQQLDVDLSYVKKINVRPR
jgi:hypothetical protein